MQQDNKPDNTHFPSLGKPNRRDHYGYENQAQEFINELGEEAPATAQRGKQPADPNEEPHSFKYRQVDTPSKG